MLRRVNNLLARLRMPIRITTVSRMTGCMVALRERAERGTLTDKKFIGAVWYLQGSWSETDPTNKYGSTHNLFQDR